MKKIVDTHHHLWQYSPLEYPWIGEAAGALKRDFMIPQLQTIADQYAISGFITVQARQTIAETQWLLNLAESYQLIKGVVGWLPLQDSRELTVQVECFEGNPRLKGIRHVVQDEPADEFILSSDFNRGIRAIAHCGWVYDILIYAKHLSNTIAFVDRHPHQAFVLDHIAKPTIVAAKFDQLWAREIRELAKRPHVSCKFSGVATEIRDSQWDEATLKPYWEVMLEAFGCERIMYGSDWPVCLLRTEYGRWKSCVEQLSSSLAPDEQAAFWAGNAYRIYGLL